MLRQFALTTGAIVTVLFGLALPWLFDYAIPRWPFALGAALVVVGLILPVLLGPVHWLWMGFGHVMGYINSRIVLSILFFLVFLPTGLVIRIFGRDAMDRVHRPEAETYRVTVSARPRTHMERPF